MRWIYIFWTVLEGKIGALLFLNSPKDLDLSYKTGHGQGWGRCIMSRSRFFGLFWKEKKLRLIAKGSRNTWKKANRNPKKLFPFVQMAEIHWCVLIHLKNAFCLIYMARLLLTLFSDVSFSAVCWWLVFSIDVILSQHLWTTRGQWGSELHTWVDAWCHVSYLWEI